MKKIAITIALMAMAGAGDELRLAPMGRVMLESAEVRFVPTVFYPGWISRQPYGGYAPEKDGSRKWRIAEKWQSGKSNNGKNFIGSTKVTMAEDGTADVAIRMESVVTNEDMLGEVVACSLPYGKYAGGKAILDSEKEFTIPAKYAKGKISVFRTNAKRVAVYDKGGAFQFELKFPQPTPCYLQDNREWKGDSGFTLRITMKAKNGNGKLCKKGDKFETRFNIRSKNAITCSTEAFVINEGADWVKLEAATEVEKGSALDFSQMGFHDAPAGKHGWLVAKDGHFEFEKLPGVRQRFYGVNFVGEANYPPAKDAEKYVANLARIGYNAVRFHHHDNGLADSKGNLREETMEKFDAMVAACIKYGIYMTTDLYVSRRVSYRDVGIDKPGTIEMREYKDLVETHEGTYQNFINYAKNFLSHVNKYTGRRYADEPAMPLYSLVNEGNHTGVLTTTNELNFARRVTKFIREDMKSRILLTNMNNFSYPEEYDDVRANEYDYMDDHFYCDHPHFPEKRWSLPSELPNINPLLNQKHGIFTTLPNRNRVQKAIPFVITEYNYSGPGRYRSMGGIETSAVAAREDVDGLWRFAWSHGIKGVYGAKAMTYFDMSGDPLSLVGERASLCMFLRRDLAAGDKDALWEDSETGEMRIVTERTCGGFSDKGEIRAGMLEAKLDSEATIWASSLDNAPLADSKRILFCHLTDVQNSGITYADSTRKILLKWGDMPHLLRRGSAEVTLKLKNAPMRIYALDCTGKRRGELESEYSNGKLKFKAENAGKYPGTMMYEISQH